MNLYPYVFVACQNENPGSVIISEFAGSAHALSGAIVVNPWATDDMADAIHTAVTASLEDRVINHASIYRYVQANTLEKWAKSFYKQLFSINSSVRLSWFFLANLLRKRRKRLMFQLLGEEVVLLTEILVDRYILLKNSRLMIVEIFFASSFTSLQCRLRTFGTE
jgi:hypothetical protein